MAEDRDIEHLYSKVNDHESRLVKIETSQPFLKDILERNVACNETLTATMQEVQKSMNNLNTQMESMKEEFSAAHKKTNEEIALVNTKVDKIEEKTKFDILLFIKRNWPWITLLIGLGIFGLSKFIKF